VSKVPVRRIPAPFAARGLPEAAKSSDPPPPAAGEARHASATVEPGSHEDWCEEHQVPESLCTRCNPSLVAAFKATGDWCEEHGLPESQCKTCNPDLKIERPPKKDAP
jgi:hypothetical protein